MKISRAHCKAGSSRFAMTNKTFFSSLAYVFGHIRKLISHCVMKLRNSEDLPLNFFGVVTGDLGLMNRLANVDLGNPLLRHGRFRWFQCFVGGCGTSELGFKPCQMFFQL